MVAVDVVGAPESILRYAVAERERGDAVVVMVQEMQRVFCNGILLIL